MSTPRNILLVNSAANHLKVGDFGLSKIIKAQHANDVYKMTGETGSCKLQELPLSFEYLLLNSIYYVIVNCYV